ncbi:MAG: hypothetical protein AAF078_06400, partial [Planctomycetota bacterium]
MHGKKMSVGVCGGRRHAASIGAVAAVGAALATPAEAVQKTWIGTSSNPSANFWSTDTFWSPTGVPTASDDALFNSTLTYGVRLGGTPNFEANTVTVANGHVTWFYGGGLISSLDITGSLGVGFLGTSPKLTISSTGIAVEAGSVSVGSSLGGVAELVLDGNSTLNAPTFNVGTGSSAGVLTLTAAPNGGLGGTPTLATTNFTLGGGTSGSLQSDAIPTAFPLIQIDNHLQVNSTGTIIADAGITTGSATIEGQFDRVSGGFLLMTVANQLTWNTTDGLTASEEIRGSVVDLQSNLALAGGALSYSSFSGPGSLVWTSGALLDTDGLSINGLN